MRNALLLCTALFSISASAAESNKQLVSVMPIQLIGIFDSADTCNDMLYTRLFRSKEEMSTRGFTVKDPVIALSYMGYLVYTKDSKDTMLTVICSENIMFASIESQQ